MLKRYLPAFAAVCGLAVVPALAQEHTAHQQAKLVKGASVAIEGCVTAGQKANTFVLGSVREIPGVPVDTGQKRIYWLDSTKHVRGHAGHVVRLEGRIDKLERHEIEVKLGDKGEAAWAEIEGPGAQVKTAPATVGVGTSGQTAKEVDIPTTVVRLKVDKVTVVSNTCS
jgi:hypothetical protein